MSFFSDLFEGNFSKLGTDITHAPESLAKHPSELYETLGGAAALATGGLGLGLLGGEAGLGGLFAGGEALAPAGGAAADLSAGADTAFGVGATGASDAGTSVLGGAGDFNSLAAANPLGLNAAGENPLLGTANELTSGGGATSGGGDGFLDNIVKDITHPTLGGLGKVAGIGAAGGLLGYDLMKGKGSVDPNQKALQERAGQLDAQSQQLRSYLSTGTLPPALQAKLNEATAAEKARIVSGYASRGQPTDPNQNSALAQELNNVDTNAVAAMAQAQIQLLQTGIQESGMSMDLYKTLVQLDSQQNQDLMKAIQGFAAALGGGGGTTIKLAA